MTTATLFPRRLTLFTLFICCVSGLLSAGCGKPSGSSRHQTVTSDSSQPQTTAVTNAASTQPAASVQPSGPGPGEKVCFACKGEGTVRCFAPGCVDGQTDCPGPCLKLTRGVWIHMDVAGHSPTDLWQQFFNESGLGGYQAFNQTHVGDVIEYQNGVAVDTGKCKICGGTGKVTCSVCKGTGKVTCPICNGKKFIPIAWTPTDNPFFDSQPDIIRLTDGRVVLGRIAGQMGDDITIVTRDKKVLHVKSSEILPKGGSNPAPAQTSPPT